MKLRFAALGVSVFSALSMLVMTGCHAYATLYPVQGPLAQISPPPTFRGKVNGAGLRVASFYAVISDDEKVGCSFATDASKIPAGSATFNMGPAWNAVYGDKFYEAHVLGTLQYFACDGTGDKGTVLHVALRTPPNGAPAEGVAEDSKGNRYKIALTI